MAGELGGATEAQERPGDVCPTLFQVQVLGRPSRIWDISRKRLSDPELRVGNINVQLRGIMGLV